MNSYRREITQFLALFIALLPSYLHAQGPDVEHALLPQKDTMLLTVFLKHDQSMNNVQRRELLKETGFNDTFPPVGVEIVNRYVMMGIGQVIVLRFPPDRLRMVNIAIERGAWGAYQTEFYVTYDLLEARAAEEKSKNEADE